MTAVGVALQFLGLLVFATHGLRGGDLGLCASVQIGRAHV